MPRKLARSKDPDPEPQAPEEVPPLLYSAEDAGRMLGGISKAMVYRYVQNKELHPIKVGSRTMFTLEELQRFVRVLEGKSRS
jgi:predicted transcriptional regulator